MFNKKDFAVRLEFFIRHWRSVGGDILQYDSKKLDFILNILWSNALQVLWETRFSNIIQIGVDNQISYESFCKLLTIGLNQLNAQTQHINNTQSDKAKCIVAIQKLIKEQAHTLAEEVEQLIITESTIEK